MPGTFTLARRIFCKVAFVLGGTFLQLWLIVAAALSNIGLFLADLSANSFLILGMAETGLLPAIFAKRSPYGTPLYGILLSSAGVYIFAMQSFTVIVEVLNCLYCLAVPLQFAAFLWFRWKRPNLHRPFQVPLPFWALVLLVISANAVMLFVLLQSRSIIFLLCCGVFLLGSVLYKLLGVASRRRWCRFHQQVPTTPPASEDCLMSGDEAVYAHSIGDVLVERCAPQSPL
jgi:amino acid transporter